MEKEKRGVIYVITSPNNKIYVGQTINFKNRCRKYKCGAFKGQIKLWNNCVKYKWNPIDNIRIIDECLIDELDTKESYWIGNYDSYYNGLNCDFGGNGRRGYVPTEETKEKLRQANLGKKHTDESKQKISEASKNMSDETKNKISLTHKGRILSEEHIGKIKETKRLNPFKMNDEQKKKVSDANIGNTKRLGKNHSDDTKNKISEAKKGVSNPLKMVKIICVNTGIIYESQKEASNKLNLRPSSISRVCTKERKTYKGLIFMYYTEWLEKQ